MEELRKIRLYDTYRAKKVELEPICPGQVDMYCCGPTVYNYAHIGNIRPVLTFDLLQRVLIECGYKVRLVSNYTDIDDKIINGAIAEGKTERELSEGYIASYEDTLNQLNVGKYYDHPKVSNYIPEIITFIDKLLATGHAYKANGNVFFRVSSVSDYGALSKIKVDDLLAGARIETDEDKESPLDFALWKNTDKGIKFDADFGAGRPGWHTECLVMIEKVFGKTLIDIHGGGFDLKFPHHENEIAQSRAANGTQLANIWMHVGFLNMNDEKMSKSLGNIILAKDAGAKYGANALRLFFLSTKYEAPINFTELAIEQAQKSFDKYQDAVDKLSAKLFLSNYSGEEKLIDDLYNEFMDALTDDLNVANSLVAVEKIVKLSNTEIRKREPDLSLLSSYLFTLKRMFGILGLRIENRKYSEDDRKVYIDYIESRNNKDFEKSDILRKELISRHLM